MTFPSGKFENITNEIQCTISFVSLRPLLFSSQKREKINPFMHSSVFGSIIQSPSHPQSLSDANKILPTIVQNIR